MNYSIPTCMIASPRRRALTLLVAAAALGCPALLQAQGLIYVDAVSQDFGYPTANLYQSNGSTIPVSSNNGVLDPLTGGTGVADGQWHWRSNPQFGVPFGGYNTIYASEQGENAPEIRMVLRGSDGLAAATNYDVYAVYWTDRAENWNIRAGLTSGNLTLYDRLGDAEISATAGTLASSAVWTTPPADSLASPTDPGANDPGDDNTSPFVSNTPGNTDPDFTRDLRMGFVGTAQRTTQTIGGSSSSVISVFIDDLPGTANGQRSWFDGLAFVPAGSSIFLTATLDRETGNLTVNNPTGVPLNVASYSISSAGGALNGTQWQNITNNNILPDPDNDWTITSGAPAASQTTLSEQDGGGSQNHALFPATTGEMNFGDGVWRRSPIEDVQVTLTLTNGAVMTVEPEYIGDTITPGDFTGASGIPDGAIDQMDYLALIRGLHATHATAALAYAGGDITVNGVVDRNDVVSFRNVFNQMNGAGSFEAMVAGLSVPEPSAALLAGVGLGLLSLVRRRRLHANCIQSAEETTMRGVRRWSQAIKFLVAFILAGGTLASLATAQVPVINWSVDPLVTGSPIISDPNTNHPNVALNNGQGVIWANMPNPVQLVNGQELVLSGQVTFTGINGNEAGGFRWGFFNDGFPYDEWESLDPPPTNLPPDTRTGATAGWVGYIANASAGGPNGRLDAKNPDDGGFFNRSHMSTFGGLTANFSGPCDNAATTAATGSSNPGCGNPVFNLASGGPNTALDDGTYEFQIVVGRYGEEVTVSASLQEIGPGATYSFALGGGIDHNGRPPAGVDADGNPVVPRPHLAFEFNRVSFLFAGTAFLADQADFEDVLVTPRPIESVTLEVDLADNGAARFINNSGEDFDMIYYDITSESGSLTESTWDPFDPTPAGLPNGVGWNVAGGSSDFVLSEINLSAGALEGDFNSDGTVDAADYVIGRKNGLDLAAWSANFGATGGGGEGAMEFDSGGAPVALGNIFNTSGTQDLRFFFIQSDGTTVRGIVDYINGGGGAGAVPEPGTCSLLLISAIVLLAGTRGGRRAGH